MTETSKARPRREKEGWYEKYLVGRGIDIGHGGDQIIPGCDLWDLPQGDAQEMLGIESEAYDWVYSSHCLEHVRDPRATLRRWWELIRPGGYLLLSVPDEDLYEQGRWPPVFNLDHKSTWRVGKPTSWSPVSYDLREEVSALQGAEVVYVRLCDAGYDYSLQGRLSTKLALTVEQTLDVQSGARSLAEILFGQRINNYGYWWLDQSEEPFNAEVSIEAVVRKSPDKRG